MQSQSLTRTYNLGAMRQHKAYGDFCISGYMLIFVVGVASTVRVLHLGPNVCIYFVCTHTHEHICCSCSAPFEFCNYKSATFFLCNPMIFKLELWQQQEQQQQQQRRPLKPQQLGQQSHTGFYCSLTVNTTKIVLK